MRVPRSSVRSWKGRYYGSTALATSAAFTTAFAAALTAVPTPLATVAPAASAAVVLPVSVVSVVGAGPGAARTARYETCGRPPDCCHPQARAAGHCRAPRDRNAVSPTRAPPPAGRRQRRGCCSMRNSWKARWSTSFPSSCCGPLPGSARSRNAVSPTRAPPPAGRRQRRGCCSMRNSWKARWSTSFPSSCCGPLPGSARSRNAVSPTRAPPPAGRRQRRDRTRRGCPCPRCRARRHHHCSRWPYRFWRSRFRRSRSHYCPDQLRRSQSRRSGLCWCRYCRH